MTNDKPSPKTNGVLSNWCVRCGKVHVAYISGLVSLYLGHRRGLTGRRRAKILFLTNLEKCREGVMKETWTARVSNPRSPLLENKRNNNVEGSKPLLGKERNTNGKGSTPFPSHRCWTRNHTTIGVISCSASGRVQWKDAEHEKTHEGVFSCSAVGLRRQGRRGNLLVTVAVNGVNKN